MAKKYLTLEEAAHQLGLAPDELVRLRERGEIRGFADRGTWKFKSEDVEEFSRSRDADSSPEVPILDDDSSKGSSSDFGSSTVLGDSGTRRGGSSARFNKTSDSDVRLLLDDTLVPGGKDSDPEVILSRLGSSDSDVRLSDDAGGVVDSGSDSDVKLISTTMPETKLPPDKGSSLDASSDSDVKLVAADSDSDVRLAAPSPGSSVGPSDSDVRLVGTDDLATLGSESDIRLQPARGSSNLAGSGISGSGVSGSGLSGSSTDMASAADLDGSSSSDESSVLLAADSGIALEAGSAVKIGGGSSVDTPTKLKGEGDSGISLEKVDSGISLAGPMDSGIALDADSGIALDADSGIALDKKESGITLADDSGIGLADSGKKTEKKKDKKDKKKEGKDGGRTAPLLKLDDQMDDSTQVEVPTLDDEEEDSSYKLHDDRPKTNVVLFADDEEEEEKQVAATARGKKGRPDDSFALQEESGVEFAEAEDFGDDADLEVAEDVLTGEGDLDEIDVFEPAEEDFDSSVQSGESHTEFAPAVALRPSVPVEAQWDSMTFVGLAASGVLMLLAGVMMFDLVRTMWFWDQNVVVGSSLLDWVRGMFPQG